MFVDEVDAARSLSFSTDEFLAAMREYFNRRAEDPSIESDEVVDALCEQLFLSAKAQEEDDNINFVRRWVVACDEGAQTVLSAYRSVLSGKLVNCLESVVQLLRLSGIVRMVNDRFETRNRIYANVFTEDWI